VTSHRKEDKMGHIRIKDILKNAQNELMQRNVWIDTSLETALNREIRAECLLELAEVFDCGSVGGYSEGQRKNNENRNPTVEERIKFLQKKYK
jgi:hypothetical protein